jgi:hypothetical protein
MAINRTVCAAVLCDTAALMVSVRGADAALMAAAHGDAVYDTARNVTRLANANLAATQKFGVPDINPDGSMSWTTAQHSIAAMNGAHYLGTSRWSMPATKLPDAHCS